MSVAVCLLLYAAVVGVLAPRVLPRLTRRGVVPAAAVTVWLLVLASVLASWTAAAVAFFSYVAQTWNQPDPLALGACLAALRFAASGHNGLATQIGLASITVAASAFVGALAIRVGRSLLRARTGTRRHAESARIVGRRIAGVDGLVLDAPQKMAYCLGGRSGTIVITSAAVAALQRPHLDAVLAHERAHLTGHHHLLLAVTRALAASLPRIRLFSVGQVEVARLLEMCADDTAARRHGPTTLLSALLTLAGAEAEAIPASALGASTVGVASRVSRLIEPETPARRVRAHLLLAAATGVVLAAPLLAAWAAASGTFSACALMP
jgi:Zn-dependent protease with chaperone function